MRPDDGENKIENNPADKPNVELEKRSVDYPEKMMATTENQEKMKRRIEALGDFMCEADFSWNIDGAFNISLYGDDFIRLHKDIDLSVRADELDKIANFLEKKGFAIYAAVPESNKLSKNGAPLDFKAFHEDDQVAFANGVKKILVKYDGDRNGELYKLGRQNGFMACVGGSDGKAKLKVDGQPLNGLDLHVHESYEGQREIQQRFFVSENLVSPIEKEYYGRKIFLENPSLTLFYKSFSGREYDRVDIRKFMELLNNDGKLYSALEVTYDLLAQDKKISSDQAVGTLEAIWDEIKNEIDYDNLDSKILAIPAVASRLKDAPQNDLENFKLFSIGVKEILLTGKDLMSNEEIKKLVVKLGFEIFQPTLRNDLARSDLENIERELFDAK